MAKIKNITAEEILDSYSKKTISVTVETDDGSSVSASVPQGKSRGSFEAVCVAPDKAIVNINEMIKDALIGMDPAEQENIDKKMIDLDGTEDKSNLGANTILALSLVCARAGAKTKGVFLWQYLKTLARESAKDQKPKLLMNIINGGLHADNNLDFQEYIIIPRANSVKESFNLGEKIYFELKKQYSDAPIGNEGGVAPNFKDNREPFEILNKIMNDLSVRDKIDFGLDAAASEINKPKSELKDFYREINDSYGLIYLEDPFSENAYEDFADIKKEMGDKTIIAGDDLTVTNVKRMKEAKDSINGMIIKPNQIGTLSETLNAVKLAREYGWAIFISHRSGETEDNFIADLAYGVGAEGIKAGAPGPLERLLKYRRLLEIEGKEAQSV